jgi:hypothetical protein
MDKQSGYGVNLMDKEQMNDIKMDITQAGGLYVITVKAKVVPRFMWMLRELVVEVSQALGVDDEKTGERLGKHLNTPEFDKEMEASLDNISQTVECQCIARGGYIPQKDDMEKQQSIRMVERCIPDSKVLDVEVTNSRFLPVDEAFKLIDDMEDAQEIEID